MTAKSKVARDQTSYIIRRSVEIFESEHETKLSPLVLNLLTGFSPSKCNAILNGRLVPSLSDLFWFVYSLNCDIVVTDFDRKNQF